MTYSDKMQRMDKKIFCLIDKIRTAESNRKASKYKWILYRHIKTIKHLTKLKAWGIID